MQIHEGLFSVNMIVAIVATKHFPFHTVRQVCTQKKIKGRSRKDFQISSLGGANDSPGVARTRRAPAKDDYFFDNA